MSTTTGGPPSGSGAAPGKPTGTPARPAGSAVATRAPGAPSSTPARPLGAAAPMTRPPLATGAQRSASTGGPQRPGSAVQPGSPNGVPRTSAPPGGTPGQLTPRPGGLPPVDQLQGRKIGRVLVKMSKVSQEQVLEALNFQKSKGGQLGRILIDLGVVKEGDLSIALAAQRGMEVVDLSGVKPSEEALKAVPAQTATTHKILPLEYDTTTKKLVIAMASHENFRALDDLRSLFGFNVTARIGDPDLIERLIAKHYNAAAEGISDVLSELNTDESLKELGKRGESIDLETLKDAADSNPVKKLINLVLLQAIKDKASDIHFEPFEDEFKMRYRIDGVLYEMMPPPSHIAAAISSRIKVMANLDIAERRMPQDGRIELQVNNQPIDLRVAVLPTMFGESVVMRVLDRSNVSLDLDKVGLRDDELGQVKQLIRKPNGIVVVTGPTGSGKTTTLYSALRELNDPSSKIITAEDPVEYDIDGIVQCQIRDDIELTFAKVLRSMLRQDPDQILIGEIRDKETAEIAVQASLTGHLVFSTLHTNDAPSAIARLHDLGLEP